MTIKLNLNGAAQTGTTYETSPDPVNLFSAATLTTAGQDDNKVDTITVALASHTPSMSLGLDATASQLAATDGITVGFDPVTGVLTLSGSDEATADWQSILRELVFNDNSGSPIDPGSVTVTATNTSRNSDQDTQNLHLDPPPVNSVEASTQTVDWTSNPDLVFRPAHNNAIKVSDANDATLTVTVSVQNGTLTLGNPPAGLAIIGDGSSSVLFSGTLADINKALNGLDYHTSSTNTVAGNVDDTLTITTNDGHTGGTDTDTIQIDVVCFYPGTRVRTPAGEAAVETLRPGDLVTSHDGRALPIRWLGRQTVSTVFADPLRVLPIRIRAGALADNVPARDLLVSPDHAMLVGDALIQAGALVNGSSIVRERDVPEVFTYYHVEVDDHSLILAENAPAETFVDNIDRLGFDNWAEYEALYPEGRNVPELPYPRAKSRRQVPVSTRAVLAAREQAIVGSDAAAAA